MTSSCDSTRCLTIIMIITNGVLRPPETLDPVLTSAVLDLISTWTLLLPLPAPARPGLSN